MLADCGHRTRATYMVNGKTLCSKCFDKIKNKVYYCCACREYHNKAIPSLIVNDTELCCRTFGSDIAMRCESCGDLYTRNRLRNYKCPMCMSIEKLKIPYKVNNYSYNPTQMRFYNDHNEECDGNTFSGIGIELEVDSGGERNDMSEMAVKLLKDEVYCKHDGSLCRGFEIITYPHTYTGFKNMNWKNTFRELILNGYMSHDSNHCGLHVHMSRNMFNDDMLAKLIYFYEKNWEDLIKFSRRDPVQADRWSGLYLYSKNNTTLKACQEVVNKYNNRNRHDWRYKAVNLQKGATVEFRLMRGTLNYSSFMACVEFVVKIAENSAKVTDIDDLSQWLNGLSDNCIAYMKKRNCFGYSSDTVEEKIDYEGDDLCA